MRKYLNKVTITVLAILVVVGIVLGVSLKGNDGDVEDNSNKNVPYGTLSDKVNYASVGDIKLTQKGLYDELRVNAYDYLFEEILKRIVPTDGISLEDQRLKDLIDEACFGTSDEDEKAKLNTKSQEKAIRQFIDQMYLVNVDDIVYNGVQTDLYTKKCKEHFLNQVAQKEYAIKEFNDPDSNYYWNKEKYVNEENQ